MATTKSGTPTPSGKRAAPALAVADSKARATTEKKGAAKPKPAAKVKAAPKVVPKTAPKAAPKPAAAKPVSSRAKKPAGIPAEQRRNYIEVAAYHIAERRGFAPGNTLDDWVQAEAEIDRLLAEGLLGR